MPDGTASLEHLPDDPVLLKGLVRELLATHHAQQRQIDQLTHRLDLLLKRVYGPRADALDPRQLFLFETPPTADVTPESPPPPEPQVITAAVKPNGHGRRKLPENLRRETEVIDIPESVKQATGGDWQQIGEEISEKLDYTPSSLFVRRIVRPKYVVRFPDSAQPDELKIAELPPEALPKSKAAPGLVADVIVSKLVDHLPLYRQEQRYARQGFSMARSTFCGWLPGPGSKTPSPACPRSPPINSPHFCQRHPPNNAALATGQQFGTCPPPNGHAERTPPPGEIHAVARGAEDVARSTGRYHTAEKSLG